jgi:hypothetical protein
MTLLEMVDRFPPILCRYLARRKNGHKPMSVRELSEASGISKSQVANLSLKPTWSGVPIDTVVRFSLACGVDLMRPRDARRYLKTARKAHLRNATPRQRQFFQKMFSVKRA